MVYGRHMRRMQGDQFSSRYLTRILCGDGAIKWVENEATTISWEGKPAALVLITDITERARIEEELK